MINKVLLKKEKYATLPLKIKQALKSNSIKGIIK